MRAAEAAKNTANLIEGTVKNVKEGSAIVTATNNEFHEVEAAFENPGNWSGRSRQLPTSRPRESIRSARLSRTLIKLSK